MIPVLIIAFFTAFVLTAAIMPLVIWFAKKLKLRQTILKYVDNHQGKSGTPTMGGIGFIAALCIAGSIFAHPSDKGVMHMLLLVTLGYGIVGFLDDFIKVFFKRNEGLSPLQKIIFQLIIAVIVSFYAYRTSAMGDKLYLPFSMRTVSVGKFAVPLYILLFLAITNSVNLTDGLDGLAASVTRIYALIFAVIVGLTALFNYGNFFDGSSNNYIIYSVILAGALTGFLLYNGYPAKIFMGDTGSLALGGGLGCLAVLSSQVLVVPILGIMYVASSLSVILQVAYYKKTGKRIFLMAPLHHHFERKGIHENRIVIGYTSITLAVGLLMIGISALIAF